MPKNNLYKTALQNLLEARKLIRYHWIKGEFARDCKGHSCSPRSVRAVSFCSMGAVRNVNGPGEMKAMSVLQRAAIKLYPSLKLHNGTGAIVSVNDKKGRLATLKMFGVAIKMAKEGK